MSAILLLTQTYLDLTDDVILIWEPSLVDNFTNADSSLSEKPQSVEESFERDAITADTVYGILERLKTEEERSIILAEYLLGSLKVPQLHGRCKYSLRPAKLLLTIIDNSYFLRAVHRYGIASEQARSLAHKYVNQLSEMRIITKFNFKVLYSHRCP